MKYPEDFINKIILGDCLAIMPKIPNKSIDMILCDLPYGKTVHKWDTIIPFEPLWKQYERIIKDNGVIVLTASQPFTSKLVMSNLKMFKYEWIWEKSHASNFQLAKKNPLCFHENILIFYTKFPTYNYQFTKGFPNHWQKRKAVYIHGKKNRKLGEVINSMGNNKYPRSVQKFNSVNRNGILHPTQKPVVLFEYLIKTYTNIGDLVLDNCMGSGTTGVACKRLNRKYILIEKEEEYCKITEERILKENNLGKYIK